MATKKDTTLATITPNLRALRLTLTISEQLLSMGVSAASVVSRALDVTETFCKDPVHVDINSNVVMLSQIRDLKSEPLTLMRPTAPRTVNNMTIHAIQDLVYRIRSGKLSLDNAEAELNQILKKPKAYPTWLRSVATAGIATGVSLMFTSNWRVVVTTFMVAFVVERFMDMLYRNPMATFFRQAAVAMFVTIGAALINMLSENGVSFFAGINPSYIVVGGIIMLLSGLAIVGAIQDAIDEYYVTANARILKVIMLTSGIVIGVLIGMYLASKLGIGITVSAEALTTSGVKSRVVGAAIAAASFALASHTRLRAVLWAGIVGCMALSIMLLVRHAGLSPIPASGIAALCVGLVAKALSRAWHTPASGIVAAGIIPLVPGLALYNGLMELVNNPAGDPAFSGGIGTLSTAFAVALAIAAGASFGTILSRPLNQRQAQKRNTDPFTDFMREQLEFGRKHSRLAGSVLKKSAGYFKSPFDDKQ